MNRRCETSSTTRRPGATLIEVLAGLVILGTLLVSIAAARGRFARQWVESDRRLAAVHAADKLLSDWMSGAEQNIPIQAQGDLAGVPKCVWRTREIRSQGAQELRARVVRLEVFDRASRSPQPIFYVEFLVHDYRQRVEGAP
jgi:type II secretory pathway pseudopilin PulG